HGTSLSAVYVSIVVIPCTTHVVPLLYLSTPPRPPISTLFPYTTLFRSCRPLLCNADTSFFDQCQNTDVVDVPVDVLIRPAQLDVDRKSTRLNSSHVSISYAVFCLKKKKTAMSTNNIRLCNASVAEEAIE